MNAGGGSSEAMNKIEHRLLQLILSPVSGDRLTLALLHWDGRHLRVAYSPAGITALDPKDREGIHIALTEIVRSAAAAARRINAAPPPDLALAHAFPVREGYGAALYWTPVARLAVPDAAAHFDWMVHELRLDRRPR